MEVGRESIKVGVSQLGCLDYLHCHWRDKNLISSFLSSAARTMLHNVGA